MTAINEYIVYVISLWKYMGDTYIISYLLNFRPTWNSKTIRHQLIHYACLPSKSFLFFIQNYLNNIKLYLLLIV